MAKLEHGESEASNPRPTARDSGEQHAHRPSRGVPRGVERDGGQPLQPAAVAVGDHDMYSRPWLWRAVCDHVTAAAAAAAAITTATAAAAASAPAPAPDPPAPRALAPPLASNLARPAAAACAKPRRPKPRRSMLLITDDIGGGASQHLADPGPISIDHPNPAPIDVDPAPLLVAQLHIRAVPGPGPSAGGGAAAGAAVAKIRRPAPLGGTGLEQPHDPSRATAAPAAVAAAPGQRAAGATVAHPGPVRTTLAGALKTEPGAHAPQPLAQVLDAGLGQLQLDELHAAEPWLSPLTRSMPVPSTPAATLLTTPPRTGSPSRRHGQAPKQPPRVSGGFPITLTAITEFHELQVTDRDATLSEEVFSRSLPEGGAITTINSTPLSFENESCI